MHAFFKNILKGLGIYHPLQSFYRGILFSVKNKRYRNQYAIYAGRGFTCNVCGSMYEKFVPDYPEKVNRAAIERYQVIAGYGENIVCPNCLSTARERLVIAFLRDEVLIDGQKVLHLSPEKNIYNFLQRSTSLVTADLTPGFYKSIDENVKQQDATRLDFEDNSFDLVIANHILEHIPDDGKAMRELFRVLKPTCRAILQVPYSESLAITIEEPEIHDPAKQSLLFGQQDHVRIYALNDYIDRLKSAGFTVEIIDESTLGKYAKFAIQPGEKLLSIHK